MISALILLISFLLLTLNLICSSFSRFLRWKLRLLILDLSSSLIYAFSISCKFLSTGSLHPTNFYGMFSFHLVQSMFLISLEISSLTHVLFRSTLFNIHKFGEFSIILLTIISSFILL